MNVDANAIDTAYRKIFWRLPPFILLCYILAYLDRINIGYAKLHMQQALNLSDAAYGLGAGIFFLGYVIFEVPSNLLLTRIGMRRTVFRIMVLWGLTSAAMMWVQGEYTFYALRFLLGVFEAGFAPAMFYYCSQWFTRGRLATALAIVGCAGPIGGTFGVMSTWIMTATDQIWGLAGWQWLFVIEGLPSVVVGCWAYRYITDRPEDANWLSAREKRAVVAALAQESNNQAGVSARFNQAIRQPRLYLLALGYFCFIASMYIAHFWLPTLIRQMGIKSDLQIGLYASLPSLLMLCTMFFYARHSDRTQERRWHTAVPMMIGAALLLIVALGNAHLVSLPFAVIYGALTLALVSMYCTYVVFWSIPAEYFAPGPAAAGGMALINSLGLIGGFLSPSVTGLLNTWDPSFTTTLAFMTGMVFVGALAFALNAPLANKR